MEIWWAIIIIGAFVSAWLGLWNLALLILGTRYPGKTLIKVVVSLGGAFIFWSILLDKLSQLIR